MNVFVVCHLLLLLGVSQAESEIHEDLDKLHSEMNSQNQTAERKVFRKVVRQVLANIGQQHTAISEKLIIQSCTDHTVAKKLQNTFSDLKKCLKNKTLYYTPKAEFLDIIKDCSKDAVRETRDCLPENLKYLPDLLLALAESQITFMYNEFHMRDKMATCFKQIDNQEVINSLITCLNNIEKDIPAEDRNKLAPSKAEFCKRFIDNDHCFINVIKNTCTNKPEVLKYMKNYIDAHRKPCEE